MKRCRECGEPFSWGKRPDGRPMPVNADGSPHASTCSARQGLVPDRIKYPTSHHTSAWKLKAFSECQKAYYHRVVEGVEVEDDSSEAMDAGKLAHGAIEGVAVRRVAAKDLASPVTPDELLASLDAVLLRERWEPGSLDHAREILVASAPRIDLSCVAVDEHGPLVERRFETPVGSGVIAGGILDVVELVGEDLVVVRDWKTGGFREPRPDRLPAVGLYAAYAKSLYPEREVVVVLDYLALGKADEIPWSLDLEERAKTLARAVVAKTRSKVEDASAWPATFGAHCARCPFRSRCETFKVAMEGMDGTEWGDPQTLEELVPLVRHMSDVASVAGKLASEWRERAKTLALGVVDRFGRATVAGHPIKLTERERSGYTVEPSTYLELRISRPAEEDDEDDRPLRALAAVVREDDPCPTTTLTLGAAPAVTLSPVTEPSPPGCEVSLSSGPTTGGSSSPGATSEQASDTTPTPAASPTKRPRKPRARKSEAAAPDPQRNSSGGGEVVSPPPDNNGGMPW